MTKYWLALRPSAPNLGEEAGKWQVRYSTPGLGFAVDEVVDDKTAHIISVAIEHGKEMARTEMRKVLGL